MSRAWRITGYEGSKEIFSRLLPESSISESEMIAVLQRLASRHLTADEVVSSSLRKNSSNHASHLDVTRNHGGSYGLMTAGSDFHYTARIVDSTAK